MFRTLQLGAELLLPGSSVITSGLKRIRKGLPISYGIDVTNICPIGCKCYWRLADDVDQRSDEDVIAFMKSQRDSGFIHAYLLGGEPYVRWKLLKKIAGIIPTNFVVTSGVIPLVELPKTIHFVSIDGKNAETHDGVRQYEGLFEKILENLRIARGKFRNFPVYIHTVLNGMNYKQSREIVQFWTSNGLADGIIFSMLTPIDAISSDVPHIADNHLRLTANQRQWIVNDLQMVKRDHSKFVLNTKPMISGFHPNKTRHLTPENCANAKYFWAYNSRLERKTPCIFGSENTVPNCTECGCIVTTFGETLVKPMSWPSAVGFGYKLVNLALSIE